MNRGAASGAAPARQRRRVALAAIAVSLSTLLAWLASVAWRGHANYRTLKEEGRWWTRGLVRADRELGFSGTPGARGFQVLPIPPDVPVCFDDEGFRVPCEPTGSSDGPLVLALGCSFTFGLTCRAEHSYPELVARGLGGRARNAGMSGYGLSQMLVLARRHVPRLEPDIVLVQWSDWLVRRSREGEAANPPGPLPTPTFVERAGRIELRPPRATRIFSVPAHAFLHGEPGVGEWLAYQARVALPVYACDDWGRASRALGEVLGAAPPIASEEAIERAVYREIAVLCRDAGARMVVVALWKNLPQEAIVPMWVRNSSPTVVEPVHELGRRLEPERTRENYLRHYCHWRGDPPVLFDGHPDERAHAVIAEVVLAALAEGRAR